MGLKGRCVTIQLLLIMGSLHASSNNEKAVCPWSTRDECYCKQHTILCSKHVYGEIPEHRVSDINFTQYSIHYNVTISRIQAKAFSGLKIATFEFWHVTIGEIDPYAFVGVETTTSLWLVSCGLTHVPNILFHPLRATINDIHLGNNEIESLPGGLFMGLSKLETIDLSKNKLTTLPADIFRGLDAIQTVKLNHNRLKTLPPNLFDGLKYAEIDLGSNQMESICPAIFKNKELFVDMANNKHNIDFNKCWIDDCWGEVYVDYEYEFDRYTPCDCEDTDGCDVQDSQTPSVISGTSLRNSANVALIICSIVYRGMQF